MSRAFSVWVPALNVGKGRARATSTGRMYTPKATRNAELRVELAWKMAGSPRLPDGPIVVSVSVWMERPKGHFRTNGQLNTKGLATPFPTRKPDADNALKLVLDALNKLAWRDDAQVVDARVRKQWTTDSSAGMDAGTVINAWTAA